MKKLHLLLGAIILMSAGLFAETVVDNSVKGNEIKPFWRKGTGPTIYPSWYQNASAVNKTQTYNGGQTSVQNGASLKTTLQSLVAGDHLQIRAGTYSIDSYFALNITGNSTNPIKISAYPGETVILTNPASRIQNVINPGATSISYVIFEGLEITGGETGIKIYSADHFMIYDCKVYGTGGAAITANAADTSYLYFIDNEIYSTDDTGEAFYIGANNGSKKNSYSYIAGNYIHDIVDTGHASFQGDGIELKDGSYGCTIKYNYITNTNYPGIICYGTQKGATDRNIIEENVIMNPVSDYALQFAGQVIVRNNLIINKNYRAVRSANHQNGEPGDIDFVNNTIISTDKAMSVSNWDGKSNLIVANNYFYSGISDYIAGSIGSAIDTNNIKVNTLNALVSLNTTGTNKDLRPHPSNGTALINGANATYLPTLDIMGRERTESNDVGAQNSWLEIDVETSPLTVTEASTNNLKVKLALKPIGSEVISITHNSGDADLSLTSGDPQTVTFSTSTWNVYQSVSISAASDADATDGSAVFRISKSSGSDAIKVLDVTINENDTGASGHTITASTGSNGSISPSGSVSVSNGGNQLFTFTPDTNYEIDDVKVDGASVGSNSTYTISNVTSDKTISVTYKTTTYQISSGAGTGGSISPSGSITVNSGSSKTFTISANGGYEVSDLLVNGSSVGALTTHTFSNITSAQTIQASFSLIAVTHTVTAITDSNGSISPLGAVIVGDGNNQAFTFTANNGYEVDYVEFDGSNLGILSTYTISNVTVDHTIKVFYKFSTVVHSITASSGSNGNISPDGNVAVVDGNNKSFTITPDSGYEIADVLVNNTSVGTSSTYSFNTVSADHTIVASFKAVQTFYTITVNSGTNGIVSPEGAVVVNAQNTKSFDIQPDSGYQIKSIKLDNVEVLLSDPFVLSNIAADHTLEVSFSKIPIKYSISISTGTGGDINPAGTPSIVSGTDQTFTIEPNGGYYIKDVLVDGNSVGAISSYTFINVLTDHTISATFQLSEIIHIINVTTGSNGLINPSSSGTIAVANGSSKSFMIEAGSSYEILDVIVDGISKGKLSTYTFYNVTSDHSISATFAASALNHTITTSTVGNGSISSSGAVLVSDGGSKTLSFIPDAGYEVSDILVNGVSKGVITAYTFVNVLSDQTLEVSFSIIVENSTSFILAFSFDQFFPSIDAVIEDNKITATLPKGSTLKDLVASFSHSGTSIEVDDVSQISGLSKNNFESTVEYILTAEDGSTKIYEVIISVESDSSSSDDGSDDAGSSTGETSTDGNQESSSSSSGGGGCSYLKQHSDFSLLILLLIFFTQFFIRKTKCFRSRTR
ncbi:MAG: hypothetical protein COA79_04555 [Planctomycetota bacterium]|nr:MAG: hypothetical protein COA79_04555 [Planctomycetota bacterium]